jgi:hypothetical protein
MNEEKVSGKRHSAGRSIGNNGKLNMDPVCE